MGIAPTGSISAPGGTCQENSVDTLHARYVALPLFREVLKHYRGERAERIAGNVRFVTDPRKLKMPAPAVAPPVVESPALLEALRLLGMGITPLPVLPGTKCPAAAVGSWTRFRRKPPTEGMVRKWFADPSLDLGIILPPGSLCIDVDAYGPQHPEVDPATQAGVLQEVGLDLASLPHEHSANGGRHYFGKPPGGVPLRARKFARAGLELHARQTFVKVYPSAGYAVEEPLPHPSEWPDLEPQSAVVKLFRSLPSQREKQPAPPADTGEVPEESVLLAEHEQDATLCEYRQLVRGLHPAGAGRYVSRCPLHADRTPSFSVWQDDAGVWRWQCHSAKCIGSVPFFRPDLHGGRVEDLRAIILKAGVRGRKANPSIYFEAAKLLQNYLPTGSEVLELALALVAIARERGLDIYSPQPLKIGRRAIAQHSSLDYMRAGHLARSGVPIRRAELKLIAAGATVLHLSGARGGHSTTRWNLAPLLERARSLTPECPPAPNQHCPGGDGAATEGTPETPTTKHQSVSGGESIVSPPDSTSTGSAPVPAGAPPKAPPGVAVSPLPAPGDLAAAAIADAPDTLTDEQRALWEVSASIHPAMPARFHLAVVTGECPPGVSELQVKRARGICLGELPAALRRRQQAQNDNGGGNHAHQ